MDSIFGGIVFTLVLEMLDMREVEEVLAKEVQDEEEEEQEVMEDEAEEEVFVFVDEVELVEELLSEVLLLSLQIMMFEWLLAAFRYILFTDVDDVDVRLSLESDSCVLLYDVFGFCFVSVVGALVTMSIRGLILWSIIGLMDVSDEGDCGSHLLIDK
jgi:hypothetical protein